MRRGTIHGEARAPAWLCAALGFLLVLAGCAEQRIRETAQWQSRAGDHEQAVRSLEEGLKTYPESAVLRAGLIEARAEAAARLMGAAAVARNEHRLVDAERLLRRALELQPRDPRIESLIADLGVEQRQRDALAEAEGLVSQRKPAAALATINEALKSNPRNADLVALKQRIELEQRQAQVKAAQLGLAETRPISLDFRDASLRSVLDVVSRNSGINFILDKDIRADTKVTVFLRSAKVEDAIDLITSTNQLAKKVIDKQTLLIYPNTPEKQREHQEQVVRVFYMASAEAKGAAAFLKSMLKIREPYVDERTNMLALRDSQENIQLAERLLTLYDTSDPEVLLEVEVIEINTNRLTELGVKFPDTFSLTLLPPAGETGLNLANVRGVTRDRVGLSIGGVTVNLKRETGDFNTLASPRIRVRNKDKARVLVGDKVPIVTTTSSATGFVSDSVSYIDVGLKLDVEPTIAVNDEVSIKIALEVSSLGSVLKTASGSTAYQIGTRNASTTLRLRDGETQLLAGLISKQDRSDASKVPGLGDLPLAGRLFSSQLDDSRRVELVLSITPRILRNVRRPDVNESELWVGTEALPRVRPAGGVAVPVDSVAPVASQGTTAAAVPAAVPSQPGAMSAAPGLPAGTPPAMVAPTNAPTVTWKGPAQVKTGDVFDVTLQLQTTQPLRGLPVQISYSKDRVELIGVDEGTLFKQGGAQTSFTKTLEPARGAASAGVLRTSATGAVGEGDVITLRFKALSSGAADISVTSLQPVGLAGPVPPPNPLPALRIQVQ